MKLTDLNEYGGIGSNCLLVEIGPFRVLIDAGLNPQKLGFDAIPSFDKIEDYSLDFIVLTHSHLDHLGSLPLILRKQPQAKILLSLPTFTLAPRMLHNSHNVMKRQRNEHGINEYPLYTRSDIAFCEQHMHPMIFQKPYRFSCGNETLEITLHPAGHLPGAAACEMVYKHRRIFFTGDVLFGKQRILSGAKFPKEQMDVLVMETTRGARECQMNQTRQSEIERLFESICQRIDQGGSCLIPAFALGRMQELLALIYDARKEGRLVDCPIHCSGLGLDLVNYFDRITRKTRLLNFRRSIVKDLGIKALNWNQIQPGHDLSPKGLYIMSSGMLVEKTPAYRVAASLLNHPQNAIYFIGYCDPDTPGGKLLTTPHGEPFVFETLDYVSCVNAHVDQFDLSSHANREELLDFALNTNPRAIVLTHGDSDARSWFLGQFSERLPAAQVTDPTPLKTYLI